MESPPPQPMPPPRTGPLCGACSGRAVAHWQRRLTTAELAAHTSAEQDRRDRVLQQADPQQPAPHFGLLPQENDCTTPVFACAHHAISLDAAARIHRNTCTAPNLAHLPGCDCTPEPAAPPVEPDPAPGTLPNHWTGDA